MPNTTVEIKSVDLATGVRLEYAEQGDPDGVPVVLLHGVTDSRRSWEPVFPHLPSSIRAIALSQRGHGDSEQRPDAGYRIADMAADVAAVIDALGLGRAVVAGHSMGGWVAQQVAIEYPERVLALVLEATFGSARGNPDVVEFCEVLAAQPRMEVEFARDFQQSTIARPLPPGALDVFVAESMKLPLWLWRELFEGFLETDLSNRLPSIDAPALLVWGDQDAYIKRAEQDRLLAAIPDARIEVHEGTGHAVHWEEPERFAAELAAFAAAQGRRRTMSSSESSGRSNRALTA
jgi:non-heme chloroperoxidase